MTEADQIIAKLGLHPHPEGGWYRQTWVGPDLHIGANTRASGTAILFLLKAGERSHWHRVDADEIWIWNAGAPLMLSLGETVARDIRMGQMFWARIRRRPWSPPGIGKPRAALAHGAL